MEYFGFLLIYNANDQWEAHVAVLDQHRQRTNRKQHCQNRKDIFPLSRLEKEKWIAHSGVMKKAWGSWGHIRTTLSPHKRQISFTLAIKSPYQAILSLTGREVRHILLLTAIANIPCLPRFHASLYCLVLMLFETWKEESVRVLRHVTC